jgi:hypothetical protein
LDIRHGPCGKVYCVNPEHLSVGTRKQNNADTRIGWHRDDVPDEEIPITAEERDSRNKFLSVAQAVLAEEEETRAAEAP